MNGYIHRLMNCGYSPSEAYTTYHSFLREFSLSDLDDFLESMEEGVYNVDRIQPQPS